MRFTGIPLFEGITDEECRDMLECFRVREKKFTAGERIASYDGGNRAIGVLSAGRAEMIRIDRDGNRTVLEFLGANDLFGETLAFPSAGDSVTVESLTDTTVVFLNYDDIAKRCENACSYHSKLVENLFRLIAVKSRALSSRVEVLSARSIREKLLSFFRQTAAKAGTNRFRLPFSMTTLADYIAADRSATARELKRMREEGVVRIDEKIVTLPEDEGAKTAVREPFYGGLDADRV